MRIAAGASDRGLRILNHCGPGVLFGQCDRLPADLQEQKTAQKRLYAFYTQVSVMPSPQELHHSWPVALDLMERAIKMAIHARLTEARR
jgi:hypothetical protein